MLVCVDQLVSSPKWQTLGQREDQFHCVDVGFEKPVNHPKKDEKQAVGMDLELRGEGCCYESGCRHCPDGV